jgi:hypothetical protein
MIGLRGVVKGTQIKIMTKWKHPHDWLLLVWEVHNNKMVKTKNTHDTNKWMI